MKLSLCHYWTQCLQHSAHCPSRSWWLLRQTIKKNKKIKIITTTCLNPKRHLVLCSSSCGGFQLNNLLSFICSLLAPQMRSHKASGRHLISHSPARNCPYSKSPLHFQVASTRPSWGLCASKHLLHQNLIPRIRSGRRYLTPQSCLLIFTFALYSVRLPLCCPTSHTYKQ